MRIPRPGPRASRSRRPAVWLLTLVALLGGGLAAALPAAPAHAVAKSVFLLGDSIFQGLDAQNSGQADAVIGAQGWTLTVDGLKNRTTIQGLDVVNARRSEIRDLIVVQLGNNDGGNRTTYTARVNAVMDALAGVDTVMWTTMRESYAPNVVANEVIRAVAAQRPNMMIVDWDAYSAGQPTWFGPDKLHLTNAGSKAFSELILQNISGWYARKQAPLPTCGTPSTPPVTPTASAAKGFWLLDSKGKVWTYGRTGWYGDLVSAGGTSAPASFQATSTGLGYWIVDTKGKVWPFGDAAAFGDMTGIKLNGPVRRIEALPSGQGYWLVASDGGVFSFGGAPFYGSTGGMKLNAPVISMTSTANASGYWLVASDGGVFSFGGAGFFGSTGGMRLNAPVISMTVDPKGAGYWLYAKDGGVFTFGPGVSFHGSVPGMALCTAPASVAMRATSTGNGYYVAATDGHVFGFGDAPDFGDQPPIAKTTKIVDLAVRW